MTKHHVIKFQATTPELLFRRKVALMEYPFFSLFLSILVTLVLFTLMHIIFEDALAIAKIYNLDTDFVFQKQWSSIPTSKENIVCELCTSYNTNTYFRICWLKSLIFRGYYGNVMREFRKHTKMLAYYLRMAWIKRFQARTWKVTWNLMTMR